MHTHARAERSGSVCKTKNVPLDDPDRHHGGVPCEHVSLLLEKGQKKHATCVRDATGVSGRGYKHEREYVVKMKIPLTVEEQAPVLMSSLWCLNVFV